MASVDLRKTLGLLQGIGPGHYVDDKTLVYDPQEISELAKILRRLMYSPSQVRRALQDEGVSIVPSNYYSEIPTIREIESGTVSPVSYGELFDGQLMDEFLTKISSFSKEFCPADHVDEVVPAYGWDAPMFGFSDAMAYYCVLRAHKPRKVVEIGSGFSSLIAAQALAKNENEAKLICYEPYPRDFLSKIRNVDLRRRTAQEIQPSELQAELEDGDVLFIDSTHTVKHGSDCLHIFLKLLPSLKTQAYIHVHDIYLPSQFPIDALRDRQIYWTEQYLLAAYLTRNTTTRVLYGSRYHQLNNREKLIDMMGGKAPAGGASLWFSQEN